MAGKRKTGGIPSKVVRNKKSTRSYQKIQGKWQLCGYSGKPPKPRKK